MLYSFLINNWDIIKSVRRPRNKGSIQEKPPTRRSKKNKKIIITNHQKRKKKKKKEEKKGGGGKFYGREHCNNNWATRDLIRYCKRKGLLIQLGGEAVS
jgi:hypothetical protein